MDAVPQKARLYISVGLILFIILASFAFIFYGVYQVYFAPATLFSRDFKQSGSVEELFDNRMINVVFLGLHNRNEDNTFGDVYYVDTILVASLNFDRNTLALTAIPRDSYVEIAGSGSRDRIRQSYRYGYDRAEEGAGHDAGMSAALKTVAALLEGLDLHYYIALDIEGLKQLIDSMGGVFFEVKEPLIGFTPKESLKAGPQLLDGQGYVTYLTYREPDTRDDLNRISRQKELLLATFRYFREMGLFSYVVPTYAAYRDHVRTDLSFNQIAALALFVGEQLEEQAIRNYSLKGEYFSPDGGKNFYLRLDEEEKGRVIMEMLNGEGQ